MAFWKSCRIYNEYTVRMNDCNAVKKMITEDKIKEKNIIKAMVAFCQDKRQGKRNAKYCIYQVSERN